MREAIEQTPELKQLYNEELLHRELLDLAADARGPRTGNAGIHAAGVVIAERPLWEYVPCFRGQNGEIVTAVRDEGEAEKAGLVKFDFLGLKTLTVIQTAVEAYEPAPRRRARSSTIDLIPQGRRRGLQDDPRAAETTSACSSSSRAASARC